MDSLGAKKLFLIDGTALIYRSYYGFLKTPLINSKGVNTSGIFGFVNTLKSLVAKFDIGYIAVAFDKSKETFRHNIYSEYKATREKMPDDLKGSLPYVYDICHGLNLKYFEADEYEADDIIASMAVQFSEKFGYDVYIVTRDKDLMQLVNDKVFLVDMHQDVKIIDRGGVVEKFGVESNQIVDFLSLTGDSSDNIPGVKGIGAKTAKELIQKFSTLDNIYEQIDSFKESSVKKNLIEHKESAYFSRELIKLKTDICNVDSPEDLKREEPNKDKWISILKELEFNSFLKEYENSSAADKKFAEQTKIPAAIVGENTKKVDCLMQRGLFDEITQESIVKTTNSSYKLFSIDMLDCLKESILLSKKIVIDIETDSIDPIDANIAGISIADVDDDMRYYVNVSHTDLTNKVDLKEIIGFLNELIASNVLFIGHNLKFDLAILEKFGLNFGDNIFDTMVAAWMINPERNRYSLDSLAVEYLSRTMQPITELIGTRKSSQVSFCSVELRDAVQYSCDDVDVTLKLFKKFYEIVESEHKKVFYDIEMKLIKVLIRMERDGVLIDSPFLKSMSHVYAGRMQEIEEKIYKKIGFTFNLNSPKQLSEVLFEKLGIKSKKKTKTGGLSTNEEVLESIAQTNEIAAHILEYRKVMKLKSVYIDGLPAMIHPKDKRIHASFNQTGTSTGRLSSSNPNLQNIPIKSIEGKEIRKAFVAPEGYEILAFDYSQIELRVMAFVSRDANLMQAYNENVDIHRITASKITSKPFEEIDESDRRLAKIVNFGILYGMQAFGVSRSTGLSVREAAEIIDKYLRQFPKVKEFMDNTREEAKRRGYTQTFMGRKRFLFGINSLNRQVRENSLRAAISSPVQGSAADIIKYSMIEIDKFLNSNKLKTKMVMQIHDELVFELCKDEKNFVIENVKKIMENIAGFDVPLVANYKSGGNWLEAH